MPCVVKQLEWECNWLDTWIAKQLNDKLVYLVYGPTSEDVYEATTDWDTNQENPTEIGNYQTLEEAQKACQQHIQNRIEAILTNQ